MKRRPSARLIVLDPDKRVLLFRFEYKRGALAGMNYWATPGGAVEGDESFQEAARRELFEETGFSVEEVGEEIAQREFVLPMPDGDKVMADERFFVVRITPQSISNDNWTELEQEVMAEHRWWTEQELRDRNAQVFPEDLADILARIKS